MKTRFALLAVALVLGACGSSSGSSGSGSGSGSSTSGGTDGSASGTPVSTEAAREFSSDLRQALRLLDANSALAPTVPDMLPGGRAAFDGKVAIVFGTEPATFETADLLGDVDLNADFRTGAISGWLDDFNTSDGRRVRGDLYVRNGQITGSDFSADIDGRLTGPASAPGSVSGTIEGSFLGSGARGVAGSGTAATDAGGATLVFQAERESD